MSSALDEYFPRDNPPEQPYVPPKGVRPWAANLYEFGVTTPKPKKQRDPNKPTAQKLKRIGEGMAQRLFKNLGVPLRKIEEHEAYPGAGFYKPVDLDYVNDAHRIKVEAKTWWTKGGENNFPLSRISKPQRRFFNRAMRDGWRACVMIVLLDGEPTGRACNTLYVIPWQGWLQIEAQLLERATGNFKGKSLRVMDIDLLDGYAIERVSGRWVVSDNHWLKE